MAQEGVLDWSAQAGSAPEIYQSFLVPAMFAPFTERLLDEVGISAGARVLDVACGTGVVARSAARRAGSGGSVTAVDMGPGMLAVARAQPVDEAAAPISYVEGDALALPVDDDAFDVATCHHGLQFFPDRPVAVAELRRALAPGGRVGIGCWTRFDETAHFVAIADVLTRHLGAEVGQAMRSPFALSADDLIGLLQGAGFEDVNVEPVTLPVTYASHKDYARLALGAGPLAVPFAAAPQETQTAIVADITEAVAHLADGDTIKTEMTSLVAIAVA